MMGGGDVLGSGGTTTVREMEEDDRLKTTAIRSTIERPVLARDHRRSSSSDDGNESTARA